MGTVKAVCTSAVKGIQKSEQQYVDLVPDWGIEDDAHAGPWHRQVSLLGYERIEAFKRLGADVENGSFGENIIVEGFDLKTLPIGTRFVVGDAVLELTQVGKQCPQALCDLPQDGGLHHAPRGRVLQGDQRGSRLRGRHFRYHRRGARCPLRTIRTISSAIAPQDLISGRLIGTRMHV